MGFIKGQRVRSHERITAYNIMDDYGTVVGVVYKPVSWGEDCKPTEWEWFAQVNYDSGNDSRELFDTVEVRNLVAL